jgi:hypothetical protein
MPTAASSSPSAIEIKVLCFSSRPEADERAEGQQIDSEEFRWPEPQREGRDARREKSDQQHRHQRADE